MEAQAVEMVLRNIPSMDPQPRPSKKSGPEGLGFGYVFRPGEKQ